MRLFVALWPPPEVVARLAALPRPDHPALRWSPPEAWHVTLRFLGEVGEEAVAPLSEALSLVAGLASPRRAELGPVTRRLGRGVLVVPVAGVDDLGRAVTPATAGLGRPPERRPFTGHVTVARARGRGGVVPAALAGAPVAGAWVVTELCLVRSHLGASARYERMAAFPLGAAAG